MFIKHKRLPHAIKTMATPPRVGNPTSLSQSLISSSFKRTLFLLLLITSFFVSNILFSQEFTYPWNLINETGWIQDMHFLPGDTEFVMTTEATELQIRKCETGELVKTYPGINGKFEYTPDSTKMIFIMNERIEVRNASDMSLVGYDSLLLGADTLDPEFHTKLYMHFRDLKIDPVKPFVYVVIQKWNMRAYPEMVDTFMISVYNYNTMKPVTGLVKKSTVGSYEYYFEPKIAVSRDGKYLASINRGASYLKIWNLPSFKLIRDVPLYDVENFYSDPDHYICEILDMKFSEIDTDILLYSGAFPKSESSGYGGLLKYSLQQAKIVDSTFARIGYGPFTCFDNEKRVVYRSGSDKLVLNYETGKIETRKGVHIPDPGTWSYIIYSNLYDFFIGESGGFFSKGVYDRGTSIEDSQNSSVLYPNPTSSTVTIVTECTLPIIHYKITKYNGEVIANSTTNNNNNSIQIDFSPYADGIYYLTFKCGANSFAYKVIKER